MYAIREAAGVTVGGIHSRDQHGGEWWTGRRWSPASDEAQAYDSASEAQAICDGLDRWARVVEIED